MPAASPTAPALAGASLRIVLDPKSPQDVRQALAAAPPPVMIVLPKWRTYARSLSDRVDGARLLDGTTVRVLAREIADDIEIVRPETVGPWRNDGVQGEPTLQRPQLVRSASLCPLVSSNEGMLIGRLCGRPSVIVLADPDLLANYGLWRGDNAVLALSVVERLRAGTGPIVALEATNDLPPSPSIWRLTFSPPFVLITFTAAIAAGVAIWLAAMRFGPPAVEEQERSPGVISLIDVATRLLRDKGDGRRLLQRYTDLVTLDLGRRLHAPRQLQGAAAIGGWLDSSRGARTADLAYRDLARQVDAIVRGKDGRHCRSGRGGAISSLAGGTAEWTLNLLSCCAPVSPNRSARS